MKYSAFLAFLFLSISAFAGGGGDGEEGDSGSSYRTVLGKCTGKNTVIFTVESGRGSTDYVITVISNKKKFVFANRDYYMADDFEGSEIFIDNDYLKGTKLNDYLLQFHDTEGQTDGSYRVDNAYITTDIQFDGSKGRFAAWQYDDATNGKGKLLVDVKVENCFH